MRLNETNRRRALKRRRKLMPEPRRTLDVPTSVHSHATVGRLHRELEPETESGISHIGRPVDDRALAVGS